jgi:hypothetical protein
MTNWIFVSDCFDTVIDCAYKNKCWCSRNRDVIKSKNIKKGDKVVFYSNKAFIGTAEVVSDKITKKEIKKHFGRTHCSACPLVIKLGKFDLWIKDYFSEKPYYFKPIDRLKSKLNFIKDKTHFSVYFRNYLQINKISDADYNKILDSPLIEYKCEVKDCTFSENLDKHHIKPRCKGGSDSPHNLIYLCPNHHALVSREEYKIIRKKNYVILK